MKIKTGLMTKLFLALTVSFGQKARNHCSVFEVYLNTLESTQQPQGSEKQCVSLPGLDRARDWKLIWLETLTIGTQMKLIVANRPWKTPLKNTMS